MSASFRDQRGAAALHALLFAGLMVLAGAALVSYTEASVEANSDLRQALEAAVKAAAFQVTPESQANGRPDRGTLKGCGNTLRAVYPSSW